MHSSNVKSVVAFLLLLPLATSQEAVALDKRRQASCTSYRTVNAFLSDCPTASRFCTNYLGRPASTSVVHTTTVTRRQPITIIKTAVSSTTVETTTYTSTETDITTITTTTTTPITTETAPTSTITLAASTVDSCPPANRKRDLEAIEAGAHATLDARAYGGPSCGVKGLQPSAISGGCSCYLDKTSTTTQTITLPARRTTTTTSTTTTAVITDQLVTTTGTDSTFTATADTSTTTTTPLTTTQQTVYAPVAATPYPSFYLKAFDTGCASADGQYPEDTGDNDGPNGADTFSLSATSESDSIQFYIDCLGYLHYANGAQGAGVGTAYTDFTDYGDYEVFFASASSIPANGQQLLCSIDAGTNEVTCTFPDGTPGIFFTCCYYWRFSTQVQCDGGSQFRVTAEYVTT